MKGIIVAAGTGCRMRPLTLTQPKCMLDIGGGVTLLENLMQRYESVGISKIAVVTGYKADSFEGDKRYIRFFNDNYENNNVLHSLMYAREFMDDDILISYADVWLDASPIEQIVNISSDIVISVDTHYQDTYRNIPERPVESAENVLYTEKRLVTEIGKHVSEKMLVNNLKIGEFIGLSKFSKSFCQTFIEVFDEINIRLKEDDKFQYSKTWRQAYLVDMYNEFINKGIDIICSLHRSQWFEIDTVEEFECLRRKIIHEEVI